MTERFQNRYRIASSRLQTWDYAKAAAYYITICTKYREHYFGEIVNREMHLSRVGVIADILWYEIKNHADNVELGEFVVMPNQIHGILILNGVNGDAQLNGSYNTMIVETRHALSLPLILPEPPLPGSSSRESPSPEPPF